MRGFWKGALGLMAVLSLAACGGPSDESTEPQLGESEQGLACRFPDYSCPGTTTCVDGLCRDCIRYPHWCQ